MVGTWVVIAIGAFVLFTGFGAGWVSSSSLVPSYSPGYDHTYLGLLQWLGSAYGPCQCPPSSDTPDGKFLRAFLPYLVAPGPLAASLVVFPAGCVLALLCFFRWRLMWVAGTVSLASSLLWFAGYYSAVGSLSKQFPNVSVGLGPYQAGVGGAILILGYVLSRKDRLDWPIDTRPPDGRASGSAARPP